MNKYTSDSASAPHDLPVAEWGHALARMKAGENGRQSLAATLAALPANACHEVFAAAKGDEAAMTGFGIMLALMLAGDAPFFFVRPGSGSTAMLYPPGVAELGCNPDRCFSIHTPDILAALRATADIARSDAAGAVLLKIDGNPRLLDLTASRRLALAAEKSGTTVLLLRSAAREAPSAAFSRWQVSPTLSEPLPANAPGPPAFAVTLLRHRRMAAGLHARLTWNAEERRFDEYSLPAPAQIAATEAEAASGGLVPLAARRAAGPNRLRAA